MKIINVVSMFLILFLLGGCLTTNKKKNDKNIEIYKLDLDKDMIEEVVEIENRFAAHGDMLIKITKPAKNKKAEPKIFNFTINGQFNKVEFAELGCDGFKQMLIYYDTAKKFTHLVIYKFKNDKVSQIFLASSNCDIETDFDTVPRVKIAKNIDRGNDCSVIARGNEWESWAWDGEKFVKEP
ncbi:MAG: hypothetical protein M0R48_01380 [Candidatus Omnitrophica bacterium]|nr:hypothetical protein [Candidatus Omnitrophota bacterium]